MDILTKHEARVLGVLIEKESLVPDSYPLSLKCIAHGCNQKTNRDPIMIMSQGDILNALNNLMTYELVSSKQATHITRYYHEIEKTLKIQRQSIPILGVLLLRNPLTSREISVCVERMRKFANVETIEEFLRYMSSHRDAPLVAPLPRPNGYHHVRWAQLLTGPISTVDKDPDLTIHQLAKQVADLNARIRVIEEELLVRS